MVPVLTHLSALSNTVERAYFCHPSVQHVFKRKDHGGFCGYLNIQMQMSYIQGAEVQGHEVLGKCIPGILDIQDMIENAWDSGIGALGRSQTGGVKGTRKWIGTPEVSMPRCAFRRCEEAWLLPVRMLKHIMERLVFSMIRIH